ncbi:hypothetical protein BUALT_Bualt08G0023600 [Buddleja alternifolia]|uniref:GRF-type domain-containing protein n=1 Tax=Buddleja alternifolia TaxID=168488 RepID=A0AAV6X3F6_9LAMI|nr:hypothetical protein BUALT_Bualt08G0023600 [Buddleja alternifolia]
MSSSNIGQVECECEGHKLAKLYTFWTNENPRRRFHACRKYKQGGCKFFSWHDQAMYSRARVIKLGLLWGMNELEVEVCKLRERTHKLQKKLVLIWVFTFVFIVGRICPSGYGKGSDSVYVKRGIMMMPDYFSSVV